MKIDAFKNKEYSFTADLYTYTNVTDASGSQTRNYALNRNISLILVTGMFGRMTCYLKDTESDVVVGDQLRNIKDASGEFLNTGWIWNIDQIQPNINAWGRREGFKGRLTFTGLTTN
jgi:hypothetical protein